MMAHDFTEPVFDNHTLELRFENDVVCIYGTKVGLLNLSRLLQSLIDSPGQQHIHIETDMRGQLTDRSEKGAIAIFDTE